MNLSTFVSDMQAVWGAVITLFQEILFFVILRKK